MAIKRFNERSFGEFKEPSHSVKPQFRTAKLVKKCLYFVKVLSTLESCSRTQISSAFFKEPNQFFYDIMLKSSEGAFLRVQKGFVQENSFDTCIFEGSPLVPEP